MKQTASVVLLVFLQAGCGCAPSPPRPPAKSVSDWIGDLRHPDVSLRREAAAALSNPSEDAQRAVAALAAALKDDQRDVRAAALASLGIIGPEAADAVPAIIEILHSDAAAERRWAAIALGKIGTPTAFAALGEAARDTDEGVRTAALEGLARIGAPAVPVLATLLQSEDERIRSHVLYALEPLGPAAEAAVPALARAMGDPNPNARQQAANVLGAIGPKALPALAALIEAAEDEQTSVRMNVAWALIKIAPQAEQTRAALTRQLEDKNDWVRIKAAEALWTIDRRADVVVPVLVEALARHHETLAPEADFPQRMEQQELTQRAQNALQQVGGEAIPILERIVAQQTGPAKDVAAEALESIRAAETDSAPPEADRGP